MYQGKNPAKNTGFFPRCSAPKRHSSLFLRTFLCRNTHVPPPPGPARPRPPSRPGPPSRSGPLPPAPAQRSGTFSFAGSAKATRPPKSSSPPSSAMPVPARPARVLAGPGAASEPHQQAPQGAGGLVARAGPQRCASRQASSESVFACKAGVGVTRPIASSSVHTKAPRGLFSCSQQASEHGDRRPQQFPACSGASGGRADAHRFSCGKPGRQVRTALVCSSRCPFFCALRSRRCATCRIRCPNTPQRFQIVAVCSAAACKGSLQIVQLAQGRIACDRWQGDWPQRGNVSGESEAEDDPNCTDRASRRHRCRSQI